MRKRFAALLFLGWLIPASLAWAESPVSVSHTLTGYTMGADSVTLSCNLTVKNIGADSISNVTLSYAPLLIISTDRTTLNVGTHDPQGEIQVPFTLTTPMLLEQNVFLEQPLFWAGEYTDGNSSLIEFPARSVNGGVL